jgi:integrase
MGRTRKRDKGLPARVYIRSRAYYFVDRAGHWHMLCRTDMGEAAMYAELSQIVGGEKRKGSMPEAIKRFMAAHLPTLSYSTRKEYERTYEVISRAFAEFDVPQVQPRHVVQFLANFQAAPTARKQYKARLSTFFRWTVADEGLRADNPCAEIRLKAPPRRKSNWTDALFHQVRDLLSPQHQCYHDLCFLLYQRTTDVRLLMRSQIQDGVIHFEPTKTKDSSGASVDVPITPAIQDVLDRAAKLAKVQAGPGGDAPVIQQADGSTYTRSGIYTAYKRADEKIVGKDADGKQRPLIGLNPKALRPYAATVAKRQGYGIEQLQVALAHTSVTLPKDMCSSMKCR